jgi:Cof subfamily protein (haloacid dehalogenase superfamily)
VVAPRFPIRLLALDLDGTLVDQDLILRPRTRAAILEATRRGVHVALATGRMATSAQPFATELGLRDPIVAYQGALVRDLPVDGRRLGRLLYHRPLPAAVARETIAWTTAHGFATHLNHLERFIIPAGDPRTDDYSTFLGARAEIVPDLERWIRRPVSKVLAVGAPGAPIALLEAARAHFAGRAEVTVSHPEFLEFLAPGVSKGRAVAWLARRLGIPLEQTLAVGDQYNDLEMIAAVGHGVAMPSAASAIQSVARYVAPPLEDEGAAQVIEALVLSGRAAPRNVELLLPGGAAGARPPRPRPARPARVRSSRLGAAR